MKRVIIIVLIAGVAVVGCKKEVDLGGEFQTVLDVEPEPITKLDILVVVDNSGSMGAWQRDLVESAGAQLFDMLETELGGLPDLHVGVVSTDLGAGPYNISGCEGHGDDGLFLSTPRTSECAGPSGSYLADAPDGEGGRARNFDGDLPDAFACIAALGIDGCGFEQPLEAARRALDGRHPENDGFLRDDALLLLVVLTDEDDCSTFNTVMFDTAQDGLYDPLGPLSSYRCFEFGVVCDGDEPRIPGERSGCEPREDSEYMIAVGSLVAFFRGLKTDPSHVAVSIVSGGPGPVIVGPEHPRLAPLCVRSRPPECDSIVWGPDAGPGDEPPDAGGLSPIDCEASGPQAYPSVRLNAFLEAFPGRAHFTAGCDIGAIPSHLESAARLAADVMGRRACLRGPLVDAESDRSGVQPRCRAFEAAASGSPAESRTSVPSCEDSGGAPPCFTLEESADCGHVESKLSVSVTRGARSAARGHLFVECLVPRVGD